MRERMEAVREAEREGNTLPAHTQVVRSHAFQANKSLKRAPAREDRPRV